MYYVYALYRFDKEFKLEIPGVCTLLTQPYYIGKGSNGRLLVHSKIKSTKHKKDAVTQMMFNEGYAFSEFSQKIKEFVSEREAYDFEKYLIDLIGLNNLTNSHGGGKGGYTTDRLGKTYEEIYGVAAQRVKDSIANSNTGKKATKETRAALSKATTAYWTENKEKQSEALRGRKMPKSFSDKASKRFSGVPKSEQHRQRISAAKLGSTQTEEHRSNAAHSRAKYRCVLNINNRKHTVIRSEFDRILKGYGLSVSFYKAIIRGYTKRGNVRFTLRRIDED